MVFLGHVVLLPSLALFSVLPKANLRFDSRILRSPLRGALRAFPENHGRGKGEESNVLTCGVCVRCRVRARYRISSSSRRQPPRQLSSSCYLYIYMVATRSAPLGVSAGGANSQHAAPRTAREPHEKHDTL
jgi:hypothetical protein